MRAWTTAELRARRPRRQEFLTMPRLPIAFVLDGLRSAANVGTIFRLADAYRVARLVLGGGTPAPPSPGIRATSIGVERWVPWEAAPDTAAALAAMRRGGWWIVAVELAKGSVDPLDLPWRFPAALVVGHERDGISPEALALAHAAAAVPMLGIANSINVATALAVAGHAAVRAWQLGSGTGSKMTGAG